MDTYFASVLVYTKSLPLLHRALGHALADGGAHVKAAAAGVLAAALARVEHGTVFYEPKRHHALAFSYGSYDPGVGCLCYTSMSLWLLGYPEQAQKTSHD